MNIPETKNAIRKQLTVARTDAMLIVQEAFERGSALPDDGHVIQYKDSLNVTNWTTLQTIVGNGALKTVTITNILAPAERYYRIRMS